MKGFSVVLVKDGRVDPGVLAQALEHALGMLRLDAVRAADGAGAFVAEDLSVERAEALRRELADAGVEARVVPPDRLVAADRPDCVRTVRIADDALHVTVGYTGPVVHLPWEDIALLSAGEVTDSEYVPPKNLVGDAMERGKLRAAIALEGDEFMRDVDREALRGMESKRDSDRRRSREFDVQLADVFARGDDRVLHFRLRSRDLYYERILGSESARDFRKDFPEVLARIAERATRAFVTPGYRAACVGADAAGVEPGLWRFGRAEAFDSFNRWQLQVLVLGEAGVALARGGSVDLRRAPAESHAPVTAAADRPAPGPGLVPPGRRGHAAPAPRPSARATRDPRDGELERFGEQVLSCFAVARAALRILVAGVFILLLVWSWLRPEGLVPYALLGLAVGDLVGMLFLIVNPAFTQTLKDYQPDGFALEVVSFVFLTGCFWSGSAFAGGEEFASGVFLAATMAGGGFFAKLITTFAREARQGV